MPSPSRRPSEDLTGRRALVTAGSRGIGRAVAQELIARGARVCITGTGEGAAKTAAEIGAEGWAAADFTAPGAGTGAALDAAERLGSVDILVANTGGPPPAAFLGLGDAAWLSAYHLILGSAIELARACLPAMTEQGWGRMVFLTSAAGVVKPLPRLHLSNVMRAAVAGLAKTIALESGAGGVTTNVIATGPIATSRHAQIVEGQARAAGVSVEQIAQRERAHIPVRRIGRPEDLAALVAFLCGDGAGFITGAEHVIDGGLTLT